MHKITKHLQTFYDSEATKFSGTRQRDWPEFRYIVDVIKQHHKARATTGQPLRILEIGCGDGRLYGYLQKELGVEIAYVGVDISYELLKIANKNHPKQRRIHNDMTSHLLQEVPDTYDFVIGIASFHHLPNTHMRLTTLDGVYRALKYDGMCIMTNRCYSNWFKKKFHAEIKQARIRSVFTLGYYNRNDIMVPWKNSAGTLIAKRLYHIFARGELLNLFKQTGFININQIYIANDGSLTEHEADGRNLVTTAEKSIYDQ